MALAPSPLTLLSEEQRTQALERFTIIRPALEKEITQTEVARTHQISLRTVQRWIKSYREQGLAGLADPARAEHPGNAPTECLRPARPAVAHRHLQLGRQYLRPTLG